jgi:mevalonate kinase
VGRARAALSSGDICGLGGLLDANQALLEEIGVSSPTLAGLVDAARSAGALGAKLCGAGWGGVVVALAETSRPVAAALRRAGAANIIRTTVRGAAL